VQLPGDYGPPRGRLLLALGQTRVAGCGALRPLNSTTAEIKRVYVEPEERRSGHARALITTLIGEARAMGYHEVRLETVRSMHAAHALYTALGFVGCALYRDDGSDTTGVLAMQLIL
jgi:putative acetyltransferase